VASRPPSALPKAGVGQAPHSDRPEPSSGACMPAAATDASRTSTHFRGPENAVFVHTRFTHARTVAPFVQSPKLARSLPGLIMLPVDYTLLFYSCVSSLSFNGSKRRRLEVVVVVRASTLLDGRMDGHCCGRMGGLAPLYK
jgi:hypothetical protein